MDYNKLATKESVSRTSAALSAKKYEVTIAQNGAEALQKIKELIPKGTSIMNGASVTLEKIGFVDYLKSNEHGWNNLHENILAEKNPAKQALLRKQAVLSDYYLGSAHALTENGEFIIASNSGSQLPHIVFTSPNLIFVVSTKKIVPTLEDAMKRLDEHVIPLEDKHMQEKYGVGTAPNKIVIFKGENVMLGRKVHLILVNENLGF
ncbi:MAG: lactate utilization protein [Patescibacteria group bacterium]|nr:LUD domain-containing protein [Patescibacteria group bacterium]MDE2015675.1 lactate utilization protein [Patescibacteria group bacterium]MDE2226732.1 lactate utilization protein [Patescibacteria group bacterium]